VAPPARASAGRSVVGSEAGNPRWRRRSRHASGGRRRDRPAM